MAVHVQTKMFSGRFRVL